MDNTPEVKVNVINKWKQFASPSITDELHLREVIVDGEHYIELRTYFPDQDRYGAGVLLMHAEEPSEVKDVFGVLAKVKR